MTQCAFVIHDIGNCVCFEKAPRRKFSYCGLPMNLILLWVGVAVKTNTWLRYIIYKNIFFTVLCIPTLMGIFL